MASRSQKSENPHYGAPLSTPKPGERNPDRPKVGDKSPDTRLLNPRPPSKDKDKEEAPPSGSKFRDYRGTEGQIDDAEGVEKE